MSNRAVLISALLLFFAGLWACWCDVAMLWDGAYQFCTSINTGHAFLYLSRFHSWVVWQPFIWLSHVTENVRLLKMAYGAPFCFAPLAGVLLSWWIVRRRAPHLMLWSILGSAMGALPGQVFMINDSIFQMHLFWPVFLAAFLPLSRPQFAVVLIVSLFQLSHPIGIGLCFACALSALVFARWSRPERGTALHFWSLWYAALCIAGVAKLFLWPDSYAAQEATVDRAWMAFRWGVLWWPFIALIAAWLAAAYLVWRRLRPASPMVLRLSWLPLALVGIAGASLIYWACQPLLWQTAVSYRRWLVPMCAPFMLAAWWELWFRQAAAGQAAPVRLGSRRAASTQRGRAANVVRSWLNFHNAQPTRTVAVAQRPLKFLREKTRNRKAVVQAGRGTVAVAFAAIFLLTLGIQSATCSRLFHRLAAQVAGTPGLWIQPADLSWVHDTAMDHWGLASQVLLSQGRTPRVLLWSAEDDLAAHENPPRFSFSSFNHFTPAAFPQSWFDWSILLREAGATPPVAPSADALNPLSPLSPPPSQPEVPIGNHLDLGR